MWSSTLAKTRISNQTSLNAYGVRYTRLPDLTWTYEDDAGHAVNLERIGDESMASDSDDPRVGWIRSATRAKTVVK